MALVQAMFKIAFDIVLNDHRPDDADMFSFIFSKSARDGGTNYDSRLMSAKARSNRVLNVGKVGSLVVSRRPIG